MSSSFLSLTGASARECNVIEPEWLRETHEPGLTAATPSAKPTGVEVPGLEYRSLQESLEPCFLDLRHPDGGAVVSNGQVHPGAHYRCKPLVGREAIAGVISVVLC